MKVHRAGFLPTLVASALVSGVAPTPAGAHAFLVRSEPADAASLSAAPHELRLTFSERLRPEFTRLSVRNLHGQAIALRGVRVSGASVVARVPTLGRGTYGIEWRVLSVEDSHLSEGVVGFGIGTGASPLADRDGPAPAFADAALRWLLLTLMAVAVGGFAATVLVLEPAGTARARRRALGLSARASVGALAVGAAIVAWQASLLDGTGGEGWVDSVRSVLDSYFGATWVVREGLIAVLAALALVARRRPERRGVAVAGIAFAGGLAVAHALSGHANGIHGARPAAVAAVAVHLLAASLWVGGVVALVVALHGERREAARACWRRFGVVAGVAVALIGVTGLYLAARNVASIDALLSSLYGRTLLAKTLLLVLTGALGLASAAALRGRSRRIGSFGVARLTRAEAGAGAAVLAVAGLLSAAAPARGPAWAQTPAAPDDTAVRAAGDLVVRVSVEPNRPQENIYDVRVVSARRPPPAPIERVRLRFGAPDGRHATSPALRDLGGGRYRLGGDQLVRDGRWRVTAIVERRGLPDTTVPFDWAVGAATPPRAVLVSDRPIASFLAYCSLAGALGLLFFAALAVVRRFARRLEPPAAHPRAPA